MDLKEIFEHKIKIESKVKSIDALFMNKERVEHTNYHPYYQRNYVRVSDVCISETRKVLVIYKD